MLLVGCTSLQGTGGKGYVSGDGDVVQLKSDDREAPVELEGKGVDGEPLSLADFRGKPVVVVVWGSWCTPCVAEAPDVVAARKELGDRVQFVGLNIRDSDTAQVRSFIDNFGIDWPSFYSPDGEALLAFEGTLTPNSVPSFAVLDSRGRIAASIPGELPSTTTLVQVAEDVIKDPGE